MGDYIEVSAKTVEDAVTKALIQLETTSDKMEYVVVEKGSTGILGIFNSKPALRGRAMRAAASLLKNSLLHFCVQCRKISPRYKLILPQLRRKRLAGRKFFLFPYSLYKRNADIFSI